MHTPRRLRKQVVRAPRYQLLVPSELLTQESALMIRKAWLEAARTGVLVTTPDVEVRTLGGGR